MARKEDRATYRANERKAWRNFFLAMVSLGVAFLLAVYSDVLAREGNTIGTAIAGSLALLLSGFVGVTWVPKLARRTSIEWLRSTVDYHLTRAGAVYIGIIFVVSIAALNTGNNMLFLILAAMMGAILVSGVVSRVVLSGLEVEVELPDHVFARQPVVSRIKLRNEKVLSPSFSVTVGGTPEAERNKQEKKRKKQAAPALPGFPLAETGVYFPYVRAGQEGSQTMELTFPKRGAYRDERIALSSRFPFGFLEKVRRIPAAREMVVYPSVQPTEEFYEVLPLISGELESYYRGRGNDLYSIRDYQTTDSARYVDWKASAHTSQLKVREFTREDERRVQLIFDRSLEDRSPKSLERFEKAVDLCAALAWHFEEINAQIQFVADDFRTESAPAGKILYEILRHLAFVQPGGEGIKWTELAGASGEDEVFKLILTPTLHGLIPTNLWSSSYFIFMHEL